MKKPNVYIAASFKHKHAVRLLGRELNKLGFNILDWTEKATPPPGLNPAQRREWMDTDIEGGQVFSFCHKSCVNSDILIYFGESGQDAGVEVGIACGSGVPILGIRGPLEAPGLMLHGATDIWVDSIEDALHLMHLVATQYSSDTNNINSADDFKVRVLCSKINAYKDVD